MNRVILSFFLLFLIVCCAISCRNHDSECLEILIQNRTNSLIYIDLYPKGDVGGLYPICDGCGGHKLTKFALHSNKSDRYEWDEVIYTTNDLNIEPYTLASKAFDSIYISMGNKDNIIIKFTHEKVTGYSVNIFSENSTWNYKVWEHDMSTSIVRTMHAHCYTFLILEDKVVIDNSLTNKIDSCE